jgi:hypothetical protein
MRPLLCLVYLLSFYCCSSVLLDINACTSFNVVCISSDFASKKRFVPLVYYTVCTMIIYYQYQYNIYIYRVKILQSYIININIKTLETSLYRAMEILHVKQEDSSLLEFSLRHTKSLNDEMGDLVLQNSTELESLRRNLDESISI